jgi:hypothetical protein
MPGRASHRVAVRQFEDSYVKGRGGLTRWPQRDSSGQREAARAAGNAAWQRMLRIAAAVSRIVGHDMPAAL